MIRLVQSADAGKAKIVGIADRWATWIVIIALTAAILTWLVSGEIIRAVTILVVFCPCALVLATPTAIMAAIGNATRHGFLVREGDALERLASVSYITFDKTGTLTYGIPKVVAVHSCHPDYTEEQVYSCTASAEMRSEHPLGKAVVRCYRETYQAPLQEAEQFQLLLGRGVFAVLAGRNILAGNLELMEEQKISVPKSVRDAANSYLNDGCTIIFLAVGQDLCGFLALSDTLRKDAAAVIDGVTKTGVTPVLLTGDHEKCSGTYRLPAPHPGIPRQLPSGRQAAFIDRHQASSKQVCMIGDGINDAPALKKSFVGIAMGGIGSDIAVDAADIALVNDEIRELPHLLSLSKRMMVTIKCNLTFSMTLNFIAIVLAITGILNPVVGALVHNAGSVLVILNSAVLLTWKKR